MFKSIIRTRDFGTSLTLLFFIEASKAMSLLYLTFIFNDIAKGVPPIKSASGFFILTVLPYAPWCYARSTLVRAANASYKRLLQYYVDNNFAQTLHWSDDDLQKTRSSFISKEACGLIRQILVYIFDAFSLMMNFILGIATLAYVSSSILIVVYAAVLVIMVFALKPFRKNITTLAKNLQEKQVTLDSHVWNMWDNIMIGNPMNLANWRRKLDEKYLAMDNAEADQVFFQEMSTATASMVAITLIFAANIYLFYASANNILAISILAATLPKQISFVQNFKVVSYYLTSYKGLQERWNGLEKAVERLPDLDISNRISVGNIIVKQGTKDAKSFDSIAAIEAYVTSSFGKYTVTGPNGCGKSTLLRYIKDTLKDSAYYLPAKHKLDFNDIDAMMSTGQALIKQMEVILSEKNIKVFLLDEWDANLDALNKKIVDEFLNRLAASVSIIEVSHRAEIK